MKQQFLTGANDILYLSAVQDYARLFISDHEEIRLRCRRDFLKQESVEFKDKTTMYPSEKNFANVEAFIYMNWEMFKVIFCYSFYICSFSVCVRAHMHCSAWGGQGRNCGSWQSVLYFHHVNFRDQPQFIMFDKKHLVAKSHLCP